MFKECARMEYVFSDRDMDSIFKDFSFKDKVFFVFVIGLMFCCGIRLEFTKRGFNMIAFNRIGRYIVEKEQFDTLLHDM